MEYFDDPVEETDVMANHVARGGVTIATGSKSKLGFEPYSTGHSPIVAPSYMRPMTPYGDTYTPSYTKYQNAAGSSYVNPMHVIFNDRRPELPKVRTTLFPKEGL